MGVRGGCLKCRFNDPLPDIGQTSGDGQFFSGMGSVPLLIPPVRTEAGIRSGGSGASGTVGARIKDGFELG